MSLERLRYFKILAERGNARETAELVGLSPSALSRSIKALESDLGVQLFHMRGKRLVLSGRGRALYPRVERLLDDYASLRSALTSGEAAPVGLEGEQRISARVAGPMAAWSASGWRRKPSLSSVGIARGLAPASSTCSG